MSETKNGVKWGKALAIVLCIIIGVLANQSTTLQKAWFGRAVIGGPMLALLVSMIACNLLPAISKEFKEGTTYCSKQFLNWGIIATGGTLSFTAILGTGVKALPLIVFNILLSFAVAILAGRKLGVTENTSVLVGGGTCICGGTAIATLSRIIKAKEEEIAFAMAAIFLFDTALAGVGFKIKFRDVFSKGLKPIALGGITWLCVALSAYAFAFLFAGYIG